MDASIFSAKLEAWRRSQEQPWNRLRYALVVENVLRHAGTAPVRILDVGGGDGRDAVPLAQAGHQVTLVDYVPEMLEEAQRRAGEAGIADRIHVQAADLALVDSLQVDTTFDVLLLHNVLQYLPDPNQALGKLAELIRPQGILSILVPNPHSEALRQALQQVDIQAALTSLDRSSHVNQLFGAEIMSWRIEELNAMLAAAGISTICSLRGSLRDRLHPGQPDQV